MAVFAIRQVYERYIYYLAGGRLSAPAFLPEETPGPYNLNKNLISAKDDPVNNVNFLTKQMAKREKSIVDLLEKNRLSITQPEVRQKLDEFYNDPHIKSAPVPQQYASLSSFFVRLIRNTETGKAIWDVRERFESGVDDYIRDP